LDSICRQVQIENRNNQPSQPVGLLVFVDVESIFIAIVLLIKSRVSFQRLFEAFLIEIASDSEQDRRPASL
jgi:hypothetical protein